MAILADNQLKDERGVRFTKSLFYETGVANDTAPFTLHKEDRVVGTRTLPSLYKIYMEWEDVNEFDFAVFVFGDYEHWEKLTEAGWFKKHLDQWRKELQLKLRSRAFKAIMEDATSPVSKSAPTSAKYILDNYGHKQAKETRAATKTNFRGRQEAPSLPKDFEEDLKRISVKGSA